MTNTAMYGIDSHWLRHTSTHRLLIIYAHPDDESFLNAGTILHYTSLGASVHYACATRGELGASDPYSFDVGALRTKEMLDAAKVLGLADVHFLGHRDSGMPGSPDSLHPQALVQIPIEYVAQQIVALIRIICPQVVVTFDPYGLYGHPDHIAIHHATMLAFGLSADPKYNNGLGTWKPQKLYYATRSRFFLRLRVLMARLSGHDPRRTGQNRDIDLVKILEMTPPTTSIIDVARLLKMKERVWGCHASQGIGYENFARWSSILKHYMYGREHFMRVVPAWNDSEQIEYDLFA